MCLYRTIYGAESIYIYLSDVDITLAIMVSIPTSTFGLNIFCSPNLFEGGYQSDVDIT